MGLFGTNGAHEVLIGCPGSFGETHLEHGIMKSCGKTKRHESHAIILQFAISSLRSKISTGGRLMQESRNCFVVVLLSHFRRAYIYTDMYT